MVRKEEVGNSFMSDKVVHNLFVLACLSSSFPALCLRFLGSRCLPISFLLQQPSQLPGPLAGPLSLDEHQNHTLGELN